MIKISDSGFDFPGKCVLPSDVFSERIKADFLANKNFEDTYLYFQISEKETISSFILKTHGYITLSASSETDFEELKEFLYTVGFTGIICMNEVMEQLGFDDKRSGLIMKYSGKSSKRDYNADCELVSSESLKEIYPLISASFDSEIDFEGWFADCSHKIRHNNAHIAAIRKNGKFVSCAASLYETDIYSMICAMCTDRSFRYTGYGGECLGFLISELMKLGKDNIFVLCENNDVEKFYKKSEFINTGFWSEYIVQ